MKKVFLFLSLVFLSFNTTIANEIKIATTPYIQTQITKSIFENNFVNNNKWVKNDSVNVIFDLNKNKEIIINNNDNKSSIIYKVKVTNINNYSTGNLYKLNGKDNNNNKYYIELLYLTDNNILLTIVGDRNVIRYKFISKS